MGQREGCFFFFFSHVSLARMLLKKKNFYSGNVHQPRNKMCDKLLMVNVDQISLYHLVSHPRVPRTRSASRDQNCPLRGFPQRLFSIQLSRVSTYPHPHMHSWLMVPRLFGLSEKIFEMALGAEMKLYFLMSVTSRGGWHGSPLQYSCLENPMYRGAWWATVHGVTKSQTQLRD